MIPEPVPEVSPDRVATPVVFPLLAAPPVPGPTPGASDDPPVAPARLGFADARSVPSRATAPVGSELGPLCGVAAGGGGPPAPGRAFGSSTRNVVVAGGGSCRGAAASSSFAGFSSGFATPLLGLRWPLLGLRWPLLGLRWRAGRFDDLRRRLLDLRDLDRSGDPHRGRAGALGEGGGVTIAGRISGGGGATVPGDVTCSRGTSSVSTSGNTRGAARKSTASAPAMSSVWITPEASTGAVRLPRSTVPSIDGRCP
jgi:hypothetical protein